MVTTKLRSTYWMEYSFLFVWRWLLFDYILLLLILLLASIVMYYFVTFGKKQFLWYFGYLIWLRLCKQSIFIKATQTMSIAQTRVKHVLKRKKTHILLLFFRIANDQVWFHVFWSFVYQTIDVLTIQTLNSVLF